MGLLDRFKGQRPGGEPGGPRAPSNFDELQAAEDASLDASAAEQSTPTVPADPGPETLSNESVQASAAEAHSLAASDGIATLEFPDPAQQAGAPASRAAQPPYGPNEDHDLEGPGLDINLPTVTPTLSQLREDMGLGGPGGDDDLDDRRREAAHYHDRDLSDSRLLPISESRLDAGMDSVDPRPSLAGELPHAAMGAAAAASLPLIGHRSVAQQQRILVTVLLLGLLLLVLTIVMALSLRSSGQGPVVDAALIQLERLGRATAMAGHGEAPFVDEVRQAGGTLVARVRELQGPRDGSDAAWRAPVERLGQQAVVLANQQKAMSEASAALRALDSASAEWLDGANAVAAMKLQLGASPAELSAANQLVLVTQRIGKNASDFLLPAGSGPEALRRMEQGLTRFGELAQGLLDGDSALQLPGTRAPSVRDRLEQLLRQHGVAQAQASTALGHQEAVMNGREARQAILDGIAPVRQQLERQQGAVGDAGGLQPMHLAAMAAALLMVIAAAYGLLRLFVTDQAQRAAQAEAQRREAELQEREAKRVNDANQAAILRLMNELQAVGEGDLTQQATVTEDITGAIADSVNYTVEELRSLVSQVQRTVLRMADATDRVDTTSIELLAASDEQLREIRETGDAVLRMAERINAVSRQSQQSAAVARQSRHAAESGLTAVQNSIDGMNAIREQIQETSKRIKRLGESSQEIGEITELISDITEQTNVLALNAAIQAASAGEAGRGFSVVAEEVQRLAERSADATREIAALVKAIQTDTQDAVAAMARSTEGVVQGAQLSDAAGTALAEIDRVSRQLAELIESISDVTSREADSANVVAGNIQHIFAVTEQTGDGTRSTAQIVRELSRTADELRQSVARFKIG